MNLAELRNLDPNVIGSWPAAIRALVVVALCAALLGAGFWFDTQDQIAVFQQTVAKEAELKNTFEAKQRKAANLKPLQLFLKEIKESFGAMLWLLPNRTEIEGLLVEISQAGLASGLEFKLFKPVAEQPAEFYAIQPIQIRVTGSYHQFGEFISAVAALPRIVTQHDLGIVPEAAASGAGAVQLNMNMIAKTYRYLEEDEIQAEQGKKKGKRK